MTDLGPIRQFLGLEIERDRENRILQQAIDFHNSMILANPLIQTGSRSASLSLVV